MAAILSNGEDEEGVEVKKAVEVTSKDEFVVEFL